MAARMSFSYPEELKEGIETMAKKKKSRSVSSFITQIIQAYLEDRVFEYPDELKEQLKILAGRNFTSLSTYTEMVLASHLKTNAPVKPKVRKKRTKRS